MLIIIYFLIGFIILIILGMSKSPKNGKQKKQNQIQLIQVKVQEPDKQTKIKNLINQSIQKVQHQLQEGELWIDKNKKYQPRQTSEDKHRKQLELLNRQIHMNTEQYVKMKRQMLNNRKVSKQEEKEKQLMRKKEVEEKVRKWREEQNQIKKKKQKYETIKQNQQLTQKQRNQKEIEEQLQFKRLEKKKMIQKKLQQIEENKLRREELLKNAQSQTKNSNPIYKVMEKKFQEMENQRIFQEQIQRKNHKIAMKIDHQALKQHQKAFLQKISERKSQQKQYNQTSSFSNEKKPSFNLLLSKDQARIALQKQKIKRRKQFEQKVKQIPIVIDEAKKVKVEIEIDKGKNRKKYNFLGQKALNDFQIYGEFRQFELNVNPKQIGNEYLKQLPEITKNSRVQKSRSLSNLVEKEKNQRVKYKDYLQEFKTQRQSRVTNTDDEIQSIIKNFKQKQKALEELSQKIKVYDLEAKKKREDIQRSKGLRNTLHKTKEIDDLYLKSLKTKLACLQINQ